MENSRGYCVLLLSPPSRRSGLKSWSHCFLTQTWCVSALAAEWIEIHARAEVTDPEVIVSALAAEWIEIPCHHGDMVPPEVSALAAEWIEI